MGGRYGLSSKNTTPSQIYSVYKMLETKLKNNFTIGIEDDVTNLSLDKEIYEIDLGCDEVKIFGFGSDGMVSASKDIISIVGNTDKYAQGYFEYDSKKSGGVTISHLRFSDNEINAPYYVTKPSMVVVTKQEYFNKYNVLENIKENGTLLINYNDKEELIKSLENESIIEKNNIRVLALDASTIADKNNIKGKINKIMEVIILNLLGIDDSIKIVKSSIENKLKNKGAEVVQNNINAVDEAIKNISEINLTIFKDKKVSYDNIFDKINARLGDELKVSEVLEIKDGTFPAGLSKTEKRKISDKVVKWIPENCTQCGQCSFVCPHAVIRPFATKEEGITLFGSKEYNFKIVVSEADCTSCGLCINVCTGKNGVKALEFGKYDPEKQKEADKYFNNYENPKIMDKFNIKGSQFEKPRFEFSGACAGCGETSYIKLLTQLYQDKLVVANATGCSSIYGGSAPSTPYTIPWANSLFEDNAEFGYGIHLSYKTKRNRIKSIMENTINEVSSDIKELYTKWLDNMDNYDITVEVYNELKNKDINNELKELLNYIPSRTVWCIGGDGWAYDIGFGGIDHVLSSNENIKVLVLDTEVYSNTGGQASKSSHVGQVAQFAGLGKKSAKKDLFRIAMCYPNCYVASISLGANPMQTIKTLKEAEEHVGPSIVIAYCPCNEHGIKGGLACTNKEQKLAVECGYTILMRYNPEEEKLYIDSKEPDFNIYDEFLNNEVRYNSLKLKNENLAKELLEINKGNAIKRYEYYKKLGE